MTYKYDPFMSAIEITDIPDRVDKIILTKDVLFKIPLLVLETHVKARRDMMVKEEMEKKKNELRDYIIAYADKVINDVDKCEDMGELHFMAEMIKYYKGNKEEREWTTRSMKEIIDERIKQYESKVKK